jgi:TonB family protein
MMKTAFYIAGFYLIYSIFLSSDTSYTRNRAYIVLSVIFSFILPLISVNIKEQSTIYYFGKTLSEVFVTADGINNNIGSVPGSGLNIMQVLIKIYLTGIIVFGIKIIADIMNLLFLIGRNKEKNDKVIFFSSFNTSGFSALGYIFINKSLGDTESEEIIRHEQNHLENNHFLDILLIETIKVFQWFNPFIYFINRSLRAIHEYQADRGCLQSGMAVTNYQNLLLKNVFRSGRFSIANSFSNPSLIKKRMQMMVRKPSGKISSMKVLLAIPVVILLLTAISSCENNIKLNKQKNESTVTISPSDQPIDIKADKSSARTNPPEYKAPSEVFVVVEEMPDFPGGDKELNNFIYKNIVYPETAKAKNIQGRVIIKFCITYKGEIDLVTVLKSVDPELDKEAVRVIKMLPPWKPGKQGGKPVNVWYNIPVIFQLK